MNKFLTIFCFLVLFTERLSYTLSLKESKGQILDKLVGKLTIVSYFLVVFIGFGEFLLQNNKYNYIFLKIGLLVLLLGILLRRLSIKELGTNWSIYVRDIDNQEYVRTGVYKYFKHPYYISVCFELFGVILIFHSILASFLFLFIHVPLLMYRVFIEEEQIKNKFGNIY